MSIRTYRLKNSLIFVHYSEVYVSDDDNRIPIRVKSKILVGSIIVDMVAFSGQKHPVNAFIKKNK